MIAKQFVPYISVNDVFNIETEDNTYYVSNGDTALLVHNCICSPDLVQNRKTASQDNADTISKIQNLHKKLNYRSVRNVETAPSLDQHRLAKNKKDIDPSSSGAIMNKTMIISESATDPINVYTSLLASVLLKDSVIEEIEMPTKRKFPTFTEEQVGMLHKTGIFEFDGQYYRFSPTFIQSKQSSESTHKLLDELLRNRHFSVRWTMDGKPVHESRNAYQAPIQGNQRFLANILYLYFTNATKLRQLNSKAWQWCYQEFGNLSLQ